MNFMGGGLFTIFSGIDTNLYHSFNCFLCWLLAITHSKTRKINNEIRSKDNLLINFIILDLSFMKLCKFIEVTYNFVAALSNNVIKLSNSLEIYL